MNPAALGALVKGDIENAVIASIPGGIEAQEAQGQQDLCRVSQLPIRMLHGCTKERLEAMGIVFGVPVDDLFVSVTFPVGWKLSPTEHHMWNRLFDDKGRERAAIFYKAAFYDRKAHISLSLRFGVDLYDEVSADIFRTVVRCGDKVVFVGPSWARGNYNACDEAKAVADKWLNKHYPQHDDPLAYWDIEVPDAGN